MLIAATSTATTTAGHSSSLGYLPILVLALVAVWLIFVRPQRRRQKLAQSMRSELAVGDEILTAGGVYGTVTRVDDDEIGVEIAPNVEIRLARRAIAAHLTEPEPEPETDEMEPEAEPEHADTDEPDSGLEAPG